MTWPRQTPSPIGWTFATAMPSLGTGVRTGSRVLWSVSRRPAVVPTPKTSLRLRTSALARPKPDAVALRSAKRRLPSSMVGPNRPVHAATVTRRPWQTRVVSPPGQAWRRPGEATSMSGHPDAPCRQGTVCHVSSGSRTPQADEADRLRGGCHRAPSGSSRPAAPDKPVSLAARTRARVGGDGCKGRRRRCAQRRVAGQPVPHAPAASKRQRSEAVLL